MKSCNSCHSKNHLAFNIIIFFCNAECIQLLVLLWIWYKGGRVCLCMWGWGWGDVLKGSMEELNLLILSGGLLSKA